MCKRTLLFFISITLNENFSSLIATAVTVTVTATAVARALVVVVVMVVMLDDTAKKERERKTIH